MTHQLLPPSLGRRQAKSLPGKVFCGFCSVAYLGLVLADDLVPPRQTETLQPEGERLAEEDQA